MTEMIYATLAIGLVGSLLTITRRYNNKTSDAGGGVAGWTIFIIFIIWWAYFASL